LIFRNAGRGFAVLDDFPTLKRKGVALGITRRHGLSFPDRGRVIFPGLRGDGGFEGDFGKGSEGTLDYWFE